MNFFDIFRKKKSSYNLDSYTSNESKSESTIPQNPVTIPTTHTIPNTTKSQSRRLVSFPYESSIISNDKHHVHNFIILDESGSMWDIADTVISGFNQIIQNAKEIEKQYPDQEHYFSILSFNTLEIKFLHFCEPVHQIQEIHQENYNPSAGTPLLDATGLGLLFMEDKLNEYFKETSYSVLVSILTDGEENSSYKMKLPQVKNLISRLTELGWKFTFIGTDQDVVKNATDLGVSNYMNFSRDEAEIKHMFKREMFARQRYSERISRNEESRSNFYDEDCSLS